MKKSYITLLFILAIISGCDKDNEDNIIKNIPDYNDTSTPMGSISENRMFETEINGHSISFIESVVYKQFDGTKPIFRIPSIIITNDGTLLVSCENRLESADKGEIDILVARKEKIEMSWNIRKVIPHDNETNARSMNPIFCIDRTGVHGKKGRIYLFAGQMKNPGYAVEQTTEEANFVFKYSDDDGKTWSGLKSLKNLWNTNEYTAVYPSACNGIQVKDGTMLIPVMFVKDKKWRSGLMIKRPGFEWALSSPTPNENDSECSVYVNNNEDIILDCRTVEKKHRKYKYHIDANVLNDTNDDVAVKHDIKAEITRNNNSIYYTTYVDTEDGKRENVTLYGSADAIHWTKLYRMQNGFNGFAYGNVACFGGEMLAVFEDYLNHDIKLHYLTDQQNMFEQLIIE